MNAKLNIKGFKCFQDVEIPLNQLTVFVGANGIGKSSAIQSLLFLRHTIESLSNFYEDSDYLVPIITEGGTKNIGLNDNYCLSLGTSASVLNNYSENPIEIGIIDNDESLNIAYEANNREDQLYLTLIRYNRNLSHTNPLFKREFFYLNAERYGPRVNQKITHTLFSHAGWQGEYVAQILGENSGLTEIDKKRWFGDSKNKYLESQVNNWLDFIVPGTRVKSVLSKSTLSAQVLLENKYSSSVPSLATNLGFGISYVLPIIVTGLIATEGSYFIVENPEAHLHPSAQSRIGRFLAKIANSGINVIIETHSDHVINGIQIATVESKIPHTDLTVVFFGDTENETQPEIEVVGFKKNGRLDKWPRGFFDQTQIDFAELIRKGNG